MNLLDIILLVFVGLCVFGGLKRGLVSQVLDLAGVVVALIVSSSYGGAFGQWLSGFLNLEKFATKLITGDGTSGIIGGIVEGLIPDVLSSLYNILGYAFLFLIVLAAFKLVSVLIGAVAKLPVLGALDKVGGVVLGFVKGFLIALVAVWILNLLPIPWAMENMASSTLAQALLKIAPGLYQRVFNPDQFAEMLDLVKKVQGILP